MSVNTAIRFLFSQPDGDDAWRRLNHGDSGWRPASSFAEVAAAVRRDRPGQIFVRLLVDHTAATINNYHFSIRHSGPFTLFVNGIPARDVPWAVDDRTDYEVHPRRPEVVGRNVYAFHFRTDADKEPCFEIETRSSPFITTDDGSYRPAPVMQEMSRDAVVCRGPDNTYYLCATRGDDVFMQPGPQSWLTNPGIEVFESRDLRNWKSLGWVWTFEEDGTWNKDFGTFCGRGPARGIFAPEIKYHGGKFWISYSVNHWNPQHALGIGILCADRPQGPYTEMSPAAPVTDGFDSNLFFDDDGAVYLLKHGHEIARMKPDMTGLAEPMRHLRAANYPRVGFEGVYLFKHKGRYHLTASDWIVHEDGVISYDSMIASADHIDGPYGDRYCALRYGGHNGYFEGPDGEIHATIWCYPDSDPHWQRVSIVKMRLREDGRFEPVRGRPSS